MRNASSSHHCLRLEESGWERNHSPSQRAEEGKARKLVKYKCEGWNDERGIEVGNVTTPEEFLGLYDDRENRHRVVEYLSFL